MLSNIQYWSFKYITQKKRVSHTNLILLILYKIRTQNQTKKNYYNFLGFRKHPRFPFRTVWSVKHRRYLVGQERCCQCDSECCGLKLIIPLEWRGWKARSKELLGALKCFLLLHRVTAFTMARSRGSPAPPSASAHARDSGEPRFQFELLSAWFGS